MLSVVITKVAVSRISRDDEFYFFGVVLDPIKAHVNFFRSFLFDRVVGKSIGGGVVDTDWRRGLGLDDLYKGGPVRDGFLVIHEGSTNFCFSG